MAKSPLETKVRVGAHEMKDECNVNKAQPAVFSTLNQEMRNEKSKLVKEMTPLCSIYDVHCKTWFKKPKGVVRKEQSEQRDCVPDYFLYSV